MKHGVTWRAKLPYSEKNKINVGFKISQGLKEGLDQYCEENNCTLGYLIRDSLFEYFKKRGYTNTPHETLVIPNHYRRKRRQTREERQEYRENLKMLKTMCKIAVAYADKHPDEF